MYCFVRTIETLWHNEWVIRTHSRINGAVLCCLYTQRREATHGCVRKVIIECEQQCQPPRTRASQERWKNTPRNNAMDAVDGRKHGCQFDWYVTDCCQHSSAVNHGAGWQTNTHLSFSCWMLNSQMHEYVKSFVLPVIKEQNKSKRCW